MARAGKVQVTLSAKDEASAKLDKAGESTERFKKSLYAVATAAAAMATAVAASLGKMLNDWATAGDEVAKMAARTQWNVESLSELAYAAKIAGTDLSQFELGTRKLSKAIVDASDGLVTYQRDFEKLGLDLEDLRRQGIEDQFWTVATAIASLEDPTEQAAIALNLFGRTGTNLFPLLEEGADGIARLRQNAHDLGVTFNEDSAKAAEQFQDAMTDLQTAVDGVKYAIVEQLGPVITSLVNDHIVPAIVYFRQFAKDNEVLLEKAIDFATGIAWVIDQLRQLVEWLSKVDAAVPDWLSKFNPLNVLTGEVGKRAGEEYRGMTGTELPGLLPGIEEAFGAQAGSMLGATVNSSVNVTVNGNIMGDEAAIRQLVAELEPYLAESTRRSSFAPVNTSGYYAGSSSK